MTLALRPHHPRQRVASASVPSGAEENVPSQTFLADQPLAILAVVVLWCALGAAVAVVLSRRGHDLRTLGPLGIALGPLLIGFATASLRPQERAARPFVLREPTTLGPGQRVLVAVLGDPRLVADALPVLRMTEGRIAQVEIAGIITYEAAGADGDDVDRDTAAAALRDASVFLDEYEPGLVLLPGRGVSAVTRYIDERGVDLVLVAGDDNAQAELQQATSHRTVALVVGDRPEEGR